MPAGQMGNSEVGHLNIGAGRVVHQELSRINLACRDGSICENEVINQAIEAAKKPGAALHLMGLLSDGGVHSSNEHLYRAHSSHAVRKRRRPMCACMRSWTAATSRRASGKGYMAAACHDFIAEQRVRKTPCASQASRAAITPWTATSAGTASPKAYEAVVCATPLAPIQRIGPVAAMQASYDAECHRRVRRARGAFDERGVQSMGDAVVFFNFRPDRARELTRAIVDDAV